LALVFEEQVFFGLRLLFLAFLGL